MNAIQANPIHILNGPNLNRLGTREPEIYGTTTLADIEAICRAATDRPVTFRQTNHEGEMVDWIHQAIDEPAHGIVINPAGLSFQSVPVLDALRMVTRPVIELHISNIHARDAAHRNSIMSSAVTAVIAGLGARGYSHAVRALDEMD